MEAMREALERAVACWNRGELDGYLELYDPEIRLHGYAPEPMGKEAVKGFYQQFFCAFPGVRLELDEIVGQGTTLMMRFHCDVKHDGPFMGAQPTGKRARLEGHTSMHFRSSAPPRVVERWSTADFLGLMVQLGLMKPPA